MIVGAVNDVEVDAGPRDKPLLRLQILLAGGGASGWPGDSEGVGGRLRRNHDVGYITGPRQTADEPSQYLPPSRWISFGLHHEGPCQT